MTRPSLVVFSLLLPSSLACGARSALPEQGPLDAGPADVSAAPDTPAGQDAPTCGHATVTRLADISAFKQPDGIGAQISADALTVSGGTLYAGAWLADGEFNGHGFIVSVPVAGGPSTIVTGAIDRPANLDHYAGRSLVHDATSLYYGRPTFEYGSIYFLHVSRRPLAGGGEVELPAPATLPMLTSVTAIAPLTSSGAVWAAFNEDAYSSWVVRSTGGTSAVLATAHGVATGIAVIGDTVYFGADALYAVPLGGGSATPLAKWSYPSGRILASNATSVFYTTTGSDVVKLDAGGDASTTLGSVPGPDHIGSAAADDTAVYVGSGLGIVRMSAADGHATLVRTKAPVDSIAADVCNVYWAMPSVDYDGDALVMAIGKAAFE